MVLVEWEVLDQLVLMATVSGMGPVLVMVTMVTMEEVEESKREEEGNRSLIMEVLA